MEGRRDVIDQTLVPVRSAAVYAVEIDGEAVLLDQDNGRLHLLNATGALVWACLDGVSTLGEIVADLSAGLDVPYSDALADSMAIVRDLGEKGLLAAPVRGGHPGVS
jgi:coenzyme PQQ synthesis protein D (PqqD)